MPLPPCHGRRQGQVGPGHYEGDEMGRAGEFEGVGQGHAAGTAGWGEGVTIKLHGQIGLGWK